ncbi:MAG: hypothetical protein JNL73_23250 [Anaerolineales bacterium]|nr:hypothetical protein [Anaerolineales bacterium]
MQRLRLYLAPRWAAALPFAAVLVTVAVACAPLFADGGFLLTRGAGDSANLLFRVHQLLTAYAGGAFPARWMPDGAYGYGLPYFTYYASFSTHVAAWFKLVGFSYAAAIKLAQALALVTGAWAVYGWVSTTRLRVAGGLAAGPFVAALAYTFAPFHLVNLYVRGDSLAELWAMAFTPLALWAIERLAVCPSFGRVAALAAVVGAVLCAHNVSALMTLPVIGLYALARLGEVGATPRRARLTAGALGLLWGLAGTAFFWLPALGETGAVQLSALTNGYFSYSGHFRDASNLLQSTWVFDYSRNPFAMGLIQTGLAVAGLVARGLRRERLGARDAFVLLGLVASTLLITPVAEPLYAQVPGLSYVQFPWRFLGVQALFTATLTGWLWPADAIWARPLKTHGWLSIGCMLVLAAALAGSALIGLRPEFVPLADEEVTAARLNLFEQATSMIGNTANAEYLPATVDPRPWTSPALLGHDPQPVALAGRVTGARLARSGLRETWQLTADGPATVALPTYWWPGWSATVDGDVAATRAAPGLGFIALDLLTGAHTVILNLNDTPLRSGANGLSLLVLAVPLLVRVIRLRRRPRLLAGGTRLALGVLAVIGLTPLPGALLQARLWGRGPGDWDVVPAAWAGRADWEARPLSIDSIALAFPHRDALRFANGAELVGFRQTPTEARPGEVVRVDLDWLRAYPAIVTLTLWPPAAPVSSVSAPVLSATVPVRVLTLAAERSQVAFDLTLPEALAPGVYWWTVELVGDGGRVASVTAGGRARGQVFVSPFIVAGATPAPEAILADLGPMRLHTVTTQLREGRVDLGALWSVTQPVGDDLAISLRLHDPTGARVVQNDSQPGGGFLPTHDWAPGAAISDTVSLALPDDPLAGVYRLDVVAYRPRDLVAVGTASMEFWLAPAAPRADRVVTWALTPELGLESLEIPARVEAGTSLALRARWLVGATAPAEPMTWLLTTADGRDVLAHPEGPAAWPPESAVRGLTTLAVPLTVTPGEYQVRIRAGATGGTTTLGTVEVTATTRNFTIPPLQQEVGATFGGEIRLLGYDLGGSAEAPALTLVFQADQTPTANAKYFVHVFDPATGRLVAQVDAEPVGGARPTGGWVSGEVLSETVVLDLADVPAGMYALALGWYDPAQPGSPRLTAIGSDGVRTADDRIVLPDLLERP